MMPLPSWNGALQPIRVVTAELPRMLSQIMGAFLESANDIEQVGMAESQADLLELTRRLRPDVVIMGLDSADMASMRWSLFTGDPQLRVLGVVGEGRQTFVYELRPHRTPLGELSPEELLTAVRRSAAARADSIVGSREIGA